MNKLSHVGRFFYSLAFTVLGLLCLLHDDFIIGRPPAWPDTWLLNPALAYVSGGMIIILSIAILAKKKGYEAALTIAGLMLLLSLSRHIPNVMNSWLNALKSVALFGGTLVIAASFNPKYLKIFLWTGRISLGAFFIACGYAHLKFYDFVTGFIPAYIPFHGFFTYFTSICLIAGGVGILIPFTRKWAALLSGLMVTGWFILLHIPRFLMNPADVSDRLGVAESLAFAGIFFVLASLTDSKSKQFAG